MNYFSQKLLSSMMGLLMTLCFFTFSSDSLAKESQWQVLDPEELVVMTLPHGQVIIALAPQFSPKQVERFKALVRAKFYDGMAFNRVIDGFVAQAGPEGVSADFPLLTAPIALEPDWPISSSWDFTLVQAPDMFAPQTGFKDGYAVGVDSVAERAWLLHCPGVIGLGRNNEPDTASSHFYITIGQAPRYLDRIMSLFGRVVLGMEHVQAIQRTENQLGKLTQDTMFTYIHKMRMMSDLPEGEQQQIAIENTAHEAFIKKSTNANIVNIHSSLNRHHL